MKGLLGKLPHRCEKAPSYPQRVSQKVLKWGLLMMGTLLALRCVGVDLLGQSKRMKSNGSVQF